MDLGAGALEEVVGSWQSLLMMQGNLFKYFIQDPETGIAFLISLCNLVA